MSDFPGQYVAPYTISRFMESDAFLRCLMGPFGSGKSTGCAMELLKRGAAQRPSPIDGIRRTKWAVVRNTYRELADTTKRTIEEWFHPDICSWVAGDAAFLVKFNDLEMELPLRALDTPDDVKKLLSTDYTGAWLNEMREIPKAVPDMLTARVGRFPSSRHGGPTWSGILGDTNPPDADHWIFKTFEEFEGIEEADRFNFRIFKQPSGLSPEAENIENLLQGARVDHPKLGSIPLYYARMMAGKTKEWVEAYVHGRYSFVREGKPVYEEYVDDVHTMREHPPWNGGPLGLGMDFGLTPAIVVVQMTPWMQRQVIAEFVSESIGAARFSAHVAAELRRKFPGAAYRGFGDPAGAQRSQVDERTPFDVVQAAGLPIDPAPSNDFVRRREAVAGALTTLTITGQPSLVVSPECRVLRKAMNGGYVFKRKQVTGDEQYHDVPMKNQYSHVAEALQYYALGEGLDFTALDGHSSPPPRKFKTKTAMPPRRGHNGTR